MHAAWGRWAGLAATGSALFTYALWASATVFNVSLSSGGLSGSSATLAFDFIDGGPPSNGVVLSALTSNGTKGVTSTTGAVSGTGPWTFVDSSFFNELLVSFGPLGTSTSFSFSTTDNAPAGASFPDAFSVFVLDSSATFPLITTNAPGGSDALFEYDITGHGAAGLNVYTPGQSGFSIQVSTPAPGPVPEPGSVALLAIGLSAFAVRKRRKG